LSVVNDGNDNDNKDDDDDDTGVYYALTHHVNDQIQNQDQEHKNDIYINNKKNNTRKTMHSDFVT
jgi:hypothetical protein